MRKTGGGRVSRESCFRPRFGVLHRAVLVSGKRIVRRKLLRFRAWCRTWFLIPLGLVIAAEEKAPQSPAPQIPCGSTMTPPRISKPVSVLGDVLQKLKTLL